MSIGRKYRKRAELNTGAGVPAAGVRPWAASVGGRIHHRMGADRVFVVKALPVQMRLGRNMDFIWQRTPFEPGFKHDIDRKDQPTEDEIRQAGERGNHWR